MAVRSSKKSPTFDLSAYPPMLRVRHLAEILDLHEKTLLAAVLRGDRAKCPAPAFTKPYRWRKSDVQAFVDDANEHDQRRAQLLAAR